MGVSKWVDPRNGKEYALKTHRNKDGQLVTILDTFTFVNDTTTDASEEAVIAVHRSSRVMVFKTLIGAYGKNSELTVEEALAEKPFTKS